MKIALWRNHFKRLADGAAADGGEIYEGVWEG